MIKSSHCTNCGGLVACKEDRRCHPVLEVLLCVPCFVSYTHVGDLSQYRGGVDLNGQDNYCRWCLDGGDLILCGDETCRNGFCRKCISCNVGEETCRMIETRENWYCFVCDYHQIEKLTIERPNRALLKSVTPLPKKDASKESRPSSEPKRPKEKHQDDPPAKKARIQQPDAKSAGEPVVEESIPIESIVDKPATLDEQNSSHVEETVQCQTLDNVERLLEPSYKLIDTATNDTSTTEKNASCIPTIVEEPLTTESNVTKEPYIKQINPRTPRGEDTEVRVSDPESLVEHTFTKVKQPIKLKGPLNFKIFSSSRMCSKPVEKIESQKKLDIEALERELYISDDDDSNDYVEAKEILEPETPDDNQSTTNIAMEIVTNPQTPEITAKALDRGKTTTTIPDKMVASKVADNDIHQAEPVAPKSTNKFVNWAINDGNILRERLELHCRALNSSLKDYDENKFRNDPMSLLSWASNLEVFLGEAAYIRKRCLNIFNYETQFDN